MRRGPVASGGSGGEECAGRSARRAVGGEERGGSRRPARAGAAGGLALAVGFLVSPYLCFCALTSSSPACPSPPPLRSWRRCRAARRSWTSSWPIWRRARRQQPRPPAPRKAAGDTGHNNAAADTGDGLAPASFIGGA